MTYIKPGSAPIYIQQGTGDPIIPYPQSVMLAEKMAAAIGKENVVFDLVENVGHADPVFFTTENVNKVLDFLDKYMKNKIRASVHHGGTEDTEDSFLMIQSRRDGTGSYIPSLKDAFCLAASRRQTEQFLLGVPGASVVKNSYIRVIGNRPNESSK